MKKLNYLLIVFAVVFTAGFSSCGGDEEVAPRETMEDREKIAELLQGNTYEGEVLEYGTELRDITISFGQSTATSTGIVIVDITDGAYYRSAYWEINVDGNIEIFGALSTGGNLIFEIVGEITENEFTFTYWNFNDGEPVTVTKR